MPILCLQDAWDYLRLCDGGDDYSKAYLMVHSEYEGMRDRHNALRASFASEVENAFNRKLASKDREIARLNEALCLANTQKQRARQALSWCPEDEDDQ